MDKIIDIITNLIILVFGDKILTVINDKIKIDKWKRACEDATKNLGIFSEGLGTELSMHRSILRYYYATFNNSNISITVENLTIALAMEFKSFSVEISKEYIYDLSEAILTNWYNRLNENGYLREKYSNRIESISYKKNLSSYNETLRIIDDTYLLNKAYFESYGSKKASIKLRVWIPRPNETWIAWDSNHCVDINVNPMMGFELGFFRVGFDYYIYENNESGHLRVAFYTSSQCREGAEFKTLTIGETSGNVIWAL